MMARWLGLMWALLLLAGAAHADPGQRDDGLRLLGLCQRLVGEGHCEVYTDWTLTKEVDQEEMQEPARQGIAYAIKVVEGKTRYELQMTSLVTLDGVIPEGTEVRGMVVSLQKAEPTPPGQDPLFRTISGAYIGDVDPSCGCPTIAPGTPGSGDLEVRLRDADGQPITRDGVILIDNLAYGERMEAQLEATYDLVAADVLPGDQVRIQTCVQYAPGDEVAFDGCFSEGGPVRSVRACSDFDFEAYADLDTETTVRLEEDLARPSAPFVLLNGFVAQSLSDGLEPAGEYLPILPGAEPLTFNLTATGEEGHEIVVDVMGDVTCAPIVDCDGDQQCLAQLKNTATLDFGDARGRVSASVLTQVWCEAHRCTPEEVASCASDNPCVESACVPGIGCVETFREGSCSDGDACMTEGVCVEGECIGGEEIVCEDDGNPCTVQSCDSERGCVTRLAPDRSRCDDGNPCTVDDICLSGVCVGGAPVACEDDDNPCLVASCGLSGECESSPVPDRTPCDTGNACTVDDICIAGECVAGAPIGCEDGNPCTVNSCGPNGECETHFLPDRTPCDTGDLCTVDDICVAGECVAGAPLSCDDGNPCTVGACDAELGCVQVPVADRTPCDSGDVCLVDSICAGGECVGGSPVSCDDGNACTADSCDPVYGCVHEPLSGMACDDGSLCTLSAICDDGVCEAVSEIDCDDGNPCQDSVCDPAVGCRYSPTAEGEACELEGVCMTDAVCVGGACVGDDRVDCQSDDACVDSVCIPGQGCVSFYNTAPCDDGDACTGDGQCAEGVCEPGEALSCEDDNPCTVGMCDPETGCEQIPLDGTSCAPNDGCSSEGLCVEGRCEAGPIDTICESSSPCIESLCLPHAGCVKLPRVGTCHDGDLCHSDGTCAFGVCMGIGPRDCDDGNPCTANMCDAELGCVAEPLDGLGCTAYGVCGGEGICVGDRCVIHDGDLCDDGNPCTANWCDSLEGCQAEPIEGICEVDDLCRIGGHCEEGQCVGGEPVVCEAASPCEAAYCDSETGSCQVTPLSEGSPCDSGDPCLGCPWPEPHVVRGYDLYDTQVAPVVRLVDVEGRGTGETQLHAAQGLRLVELPDGTLALRGPLEAQGEAGAAVAWDVDIRFERIGVGHAGLGSGYLLGRPEEGVTPFESDHWEAWAPRTGGQLQRLTDGAVLEIVTSSATPLVLGRGAGLELADDGVGLDFNWRRGGRSGEGLLRSGLEQVFCEERSSCQANVCEGGSVAPSCRELSPTDYCAFDAEAFGGTCAGDDSAACLLESSFDAIALHAGACSADVPGFVYGHRGHGRWSFSSAPRISTFLPTRGLEELPADGEPDGHCDPLATDASPEFGDALAMALNIALSDARVLPAPGGVPLGDLRLSTGPCTGLSLRELSWRAEVVLSGGTLDAETCTTRRDLLLEIARIIDGFDGCESLPSGVVLPP